MKACARYFLSKHDSPSKTMKNVLYFILKALFVLEIFRFLYLRLPHFFPLSAIALRRISTRRFHREIASKLIHHETIFNFHMNNSVTIIENIRYQK